MTQPDRRHLRRARLALAVVVAAALAAWLWFPGGRTFLQQSLTALASLDPQQVRGFIAAWGPQAALVSFALMILQAIVAPLPAFLITLANAALFGAFWGGALSWFSAMVGAGLCFCIARALGREVVEKLTGRAMLRHDGEEGGIVLRGRIELTVGDRREILGPGDAYHFSSRIPHRFRNPGDEECELISACTPPYL